MKVMGKLKEQAHRHKGTKAQRIEDQEIIR